MSDPLSVTASIAGVIGLADLIFKRSIQFLKYCKDASKAKEDLQNLATQVGLLSGTLVQLRKLIELLDQEPFEASLKAHAGIIDACEGTLMTIQDKLKVPSTSLNSSNKVSRFITKAKWPFSSEEIASLLVDISRHQGSIQLALSADSMNGILRCLSRSNSIHQQLADTSGNVKRVLDICVRTKIDSRRKDIVKFFMKVNPSQYFQTSVNLRHPDTGEWLKSCNEVRQWLNAPRNNIWLVGIAGAGKTVLSGLLIEEALEASNDDLAVAFFYCDYQNEQTRSLEDILGAIICQIAMQKNQAFQVLERYYDELNSSGNLSKVATSEELLDLLQEMNSLFSHTVLIIDGIDECFRLTGEVLPSLLKISKLNKVSLAVTSRDELPIRQMMEDAFMEVVISARNDDVLRYVRDEIETRIQDKRLRNIAASMKDDILSSLVKGGGGMFRWVACQLDYLCEFYTDRQRKKALEDLPPDLPKTYLRILERVPKRQADLVSLTLKFLAHSRDPMTIDELSEALSIPEDGSCLVPEDYTTCDEVMDACSSLVRKSNCGQYLEFAHSSVKQFLESDDLLTGPLSQYKLSSSDDRALATRCLRFLQLENFVRVPLAIADEVRDVEDRENKFPFYKHAARFWPGYAAEHLKDGELITLLKKLFNPLRTGVFTAWATSFFLQLGRSRHISDTIKHAYLGEMCESPLYLAAILALPELCEHLLQYANLSTQAQQASEFLLLGIEWTDFGAAKDLLNMNHKRLGLSFNSVNNTWDKLAKCIKPTIKGTLFDLGSGNPQNIQKNGKSQFDTLLSTIILRAVLFDPLYIILAAKVILFVSYSGFIVPSSLPDTTDRIERLKLYLRKYGSSKLAEIKRDRLESLLSITMQELNVLVGNHMLIADLCSICWQMASIRKLDITLDRSFVDTTIMYRSETELLNATLVAIEIDDLPFLKCAVRDPRVKASKLTIDGNMGLIAFAVEQWVSVESLRVLLEAGWGSTPNEALNPLHLWAMTCYERSIPEAEPIFELLLRHGASTLTRTGQPNDRWPVALGSTAWHLASGSLSALQILLKHEGAEHLPEILSTTNEDGYTPVTEALKRGKADCVMLLLSHCNGEAQCFQSPVSPFALAAQIGRAIVLQRLIELGVDSTLPPGCKRCPLHFLAPDSTDMCLEMLIEFYAPSCPMRCAEEPPIISVIRHCLPNNSDHETHGGGVPTMNILSKLLQVSGGSTEMKAKTWELACRIFTGEEKSSKNSNLAIQQYVRGTVRALVSLGTLEAFEKVFERSGLEPLLDGLDELHHDVEATGDYENFEHEQSQDQDEDYIPGSCLYPVGPILISQVLSATNDGFLPTFGQSKLGVLILKLTLAEADRCQKSRDLANRVLDYGFSIHQRHDYEYSPIEQACFQQSIDIDLFQGLLNKANLHQLEGVHPRTGEGLLHLLSKRAGKNTQAMLRKLLGRGLDPNSRLGVTPRSPVLNVYLDAKREDLAYILLEHGANPKIRCEWNKDAMLTAVWTHSVAFLERLLAWSREEEGRLIDWTQTNQVTTRFGSEQSFASMNMLHTASVLGDVALVTFFLDNKLLDVNAVSKCGATALHYAAYEGSVETINMLLKHGADLNCLDENGHRARDWALLTDSNAAVQALASAQVHQEALKPRTESIVDMGEKNMDTNMKSRHISRRPPSRVEEPKLQSSVFEAKLRLLLADGNLERCKELFRRAQAFSINKQLYRFRGSTTLFVAARMDHVEIVEWALQMGSSTIGYEIETGLTVLEVAVESSIMNRALTALLDRSLEEGASWVSEPTSLVLTAVQSGNAKAVAIIIRHVRDHHDQYIEATGIQCSSLIDAIVNQASQFSLTTPLHLAARAGDLKLVKLLVQNGANIDAQDSEGLTALSDATISSALHSIDVMRYLVSCGASLNAKTRLGNVALTFASSSEPKFRLLVEAGADIFTKSVNLRNLLHTIPYEYNGRRGTCSPITTNWASLVYRGLSPNAEDDTQVTPVHIAMTREQFTGLLLNGDFGVHSIASFPLSILSDNRPVAWLRKMFRLYRRRIGAEQLLLTLTAPEVGTRITPLCAAAGGLDSVTVTNILSAGVDIDCEGHPSGSAIMVACESGRLEIVKVLVRHGAQLCYDGPNGEKSAFELARNYQQILRWLLVLRYTDQPKLQDRAFSADASLCFWSGIQRRTIWSKKCERAFEESLIDYVGRLRRMKKDVQGKVAPPSSSNIPKDSQYASLNVEFGCYIRDHFVAPHTKMNLKENVADWTRQLYAMKADVLTADVCEDDNTSSASWDSDWS